MHTTKLATMTGNYWRLSCIRNGRSTEETTTQEALDGLNEIIAELGPKRLVRRSATLLMADIISPKRKKRFGKKVHPPINLTNYPNFLKDVIANG